MVCLNKKIPVNVSLMKKVFIIEIEEIIEHELYYLNDINDKKKDRIKNNIIKEFRRTINTDFFIKRIMHDEHCSFKHTRGKRDGEFCCKRITKNGNKKKYVCTQHNKDHVPQKRLIKDNSNDILIKKPINLIDNNKSILDNSIDLIKTKKDEPNIELLDFVGVKINNSNISKNRKINNKHNYDNKLNEIKKYKKNYKFKNNIKNYEYNYFENIICNYKEENLCYDIKNHGCCNFKHINNIYLNDFLHDKHQFYENNNLIKIH